MVLIHAFLAIYNKITGGGRGFGMSIHSPGTSKTLQNDHHNALSYHRFGERESWNHSALNRVPSKQATLELGRWCLSASTQISGVIKQTYVVTNYQEVTGVYYPCTHTPMSWNSVALVGPSGK